MSLHRPRVLIVDDEPSIQRVIAAGLTAEGYEVLPVGTGQQALAEIVSRAPDLVLLDLGLPDMDGQDVLRRAHDLYDGPVIVLSARTRGTDKIEALDQGAEDYVEKPFNIGELTARIRVALRRRRLAGPPRTASAGDLVIDFERQMVSRAGEVVRLSRIEYEVLVRLAEANGKIVPHERLVSEIGSADQAHKIQVLRVYVSQIRKKIGDDPANPRILQTQLGVGYRFIGDR
jgi:two-component system KDP operon response regulator KdpE